MSRAAVCVITSTDPVFLLSPSLPLFSSVSSSLRATEDGGLISADTCSSFSSSSSFLGRSPRLRTVAGAVPRMWAPLLGQAAVFAALLGLSTCLTGSHMCPRSLDCARAGRRFCQPGSSHCGPCLHPLVENYRGQCVIKRRHASHSAHVVKGKVSRYPELDEEIDFLSAIISEQRTESRLPAPPSQDVPKSKSVELSDPVYDHRASVTELPTSQSAVVTSLAPATNTTNHTSTLLGDPIILPYPSNDHVFLIVSSIFIVAGSLALILAGACWVRLQKGLQLTQKFDPSTHQLIRAQTLPGDKKLAHSAQMYHYQHQKQQMLSLEKQRDDPKLPDSGASTDEENEEGDFTVYECPGLAPTGEMEVKNPLFDDSPHYLQKFR